MSSICSHSLGKKLIFWWDELRDFLAISTYLYERYLLSSEQSMQLHGIHMVTATVIQAVGWDSRLEGVLCALQVACLGMEGGGEGEASLILHIYV